MQEDFLMQKMTILQLQKLKKAHGKKASLRKKLPAPSEGGVPAET